MNLTSNFKHFFPVGFYGTQNKQSLLFIIYFSTYFDRDKLTRVRNPDTTMEELRFTLSFFRPGWRNAGLGERPVLVLMDCYEVLKYFHPLSLLCFHSWQLFTSPEG